MTSNRWRWRRRRSSSRTRRRSKPCGTESNSSLRCLRHRSALVPLKGQSLLRRSPSFTNNWWGREEGNQNLLPPNLWSKSIFIGDVKKFTSVITVKKKKTLLVFSNLNVNSYVTWHEKAKKLLSNLTTSSNLILVINICFS